MKKAKLKEMKKNTSKKNIKETQESVGVKKAFVTITVILITFGAFYFLTDFLLSKRTTPKVESNSNSTTNTKEIAFLDILKQSSKDYYVFALTDKKDEKVYQQYAGYNSKTYYTVDMTTPMNKNHLADKTSISDSVKDIKISDTTLFVVKDGKIEKHFTGYDDITNYLKKNISTNFNIK